MPGYKLGRTSEDIKRELSDIMRGLKDPRISGMLSVVRVDLSSDLSYCKVFVSSLEGIESAKQSVVGLKSAQGYIKRELGMRLSLRKTPELQFIADDSIEVSAKIAKVLGDLSREADQRGKPEEPQEP